MYTIKFFYNLQFIYIVKKGEFFMSVNDHKCHACGADLTFDPSSQKWVCEYCGESYTLEDIKKYQAQSATQTSSNTSVDGYNECHCKSCGAQIIMDENTSVTECVYCGNTAIITERLEGNFAPQQLIPFKKTKDDALAAFSNYRKGKWFMPKEFLEQKNIEKISGIYIPFYLYDIDVAARIHVNATKVEHWSDSSYRYTKTDYFEVLREGRMSFNEIPTDASTKFPDNIMDSIEPYDYKDLIDFDSSYIAGFLSEKYDQTIEELSERAEKRAKKTAVDTLLKDVSGYNSKTVTDSVERAKRKDSSKYVLLPVWMLNIKYNDKMYTLAMNGQTGKFIGNVPVSWKSALRFWIYTFIITSLLAMIIGILMYGNLF